MMESSLFRVQLPATDTTESNNRGGLFNQFVQPLCVLLFGAAFPPTHHPTEEGAGYHRLAAFFFADIEGLQSPQEVQPALHFPIDMASVN